MSDPRWLDVFDDIESALNHFVQAQIIYDESNFDGADRQAYVASMALMHSMQCGHTSAEAAFVRILKILKEKPPSGDDWHETILRRLAQGRSDEYARPALLTKELYSALKETRKFRHRAIHIYEDFDVKRVPPAMEAAKVVASQLRPAVTAFQAAVDP